MQEVDSSDEAIEAYWKVQSVIFREEVSDVNKDWTHKDKDKDKDQTLKDQDKDRD